MTSSEHEDAAHDTVKRGCNTRADHRLALQQSHNNGGCKEARSSAGGSVG